MRITLLLAFFLALSPEAADAKGPNLIFILTDDQGWFDIASHGDKHIETPVLDRLASEGARFSHFYAMPVCTPTRAGLMTGRYPQRTRAMDTFMGRDVMDEKEITIAQLFQQKGYRTGIFGKWHLGRYMKYHPNERGFDEFFGFWQYGFINRYMDSDELFQDKKPVVTTGYITDVLTDGAIDFLKRHRDAPFFLYLPYNAPHDPHLVPDHYINRYLKKGLPLNEARIYGMVTSIDENVGRLLKSVDDLGLRENTLVVFMTDNGGVSKFEKCGLRGNKGSVYEGGVRVPLFMRWPGKIKAGHTVSAMAQFIDLFPTFAEFGGVQLPKDRKLDGKNLWPLLKGETTQSPHQYLFHQWSRVRPQDDQNWAVRDTRYKLVNGELFDLEKDPGESKNLAGERPEDVKRLRARFEEWFEEVTAGIDYQTPVPIEIGRPDENPVELDVTWARPVGKSIKPTYRRYIRDAIQNWSDPADYVRFSVAVVQPGRYEVRLAYGCEPGDQGGTFEIVAGEEKLAGSTQKTTGRDVFAEHSIGTILLSAPVTSIEIRALQIPGKELMSLHKVWLRKVD